MWDLRMMAREVTTLRGHRCVTACCACVPTGVADGRGDV